MDLGIRRDANTCCGRLLADGAVTDLFIENVLADDDLHIQLLGSLLRVLDREAGKVRNGVPVVLRAGRSLRSERNLNADGLIVHDALALGDALLDDKSLSGLVMRIGDRSIAAGFLDDLNGLFFSHADHIRHLIRRRMILKMERRAHQREDKHHKRKRAQDDRRDQQALETRVCPVPCGSH